jgi:V/A-type H+-transporting ATPase subunit B
MTGKEYRTITDVKGPLVFLNKTEPVAFGEIVTLRLSNGTIKNGQVLDTSDDMVIVQVFEGTAKIDRQAGVTFMGDVFKLPVSEDLVGRILDGAGRPRDGGPEIVAEEKADIIGAAINPYSRQSPNDFIQTGVSAIDLCTSLVRGQKAANFLGIRSPAQRHCIANCTSSKTQGL